MSKIIANSPRKTIKYQLFSINAFITVIIYYYTVYIVLSDTTNWRACLSSREDVRKSLRRWAIWRVLDNERRNDA